MQSRLVGGAHGGHRRDDGTGGTGAYRRRAHAPRGAPGDSTRYDHRSSRGGGGGGRTSSRLPAGLGGVQLPRLLGGNQPDLDEVKRADEAVADAEAARAADRVAQRNQGLAVAGPGSYFACFLGAR